MENNIEQWARELQETILREAREKYSEVVIDHWMHPRNFGQMECPDGYAKIKGPCGDTMEIFLRVSRDGRIEEASFLTDGCGTSIASGSACVTVILGKTLSEARRIRQETLLDYMKGLPEEDRHCPLLAAKTLHLAIENAKLMKADPWKKQYENR